MAFRNALDKNDKPLSFFGRVCVNTTKVAQSGCDILYRSRTDGTRNGEEMHKRKPRIDDVAKAAGVSFITAWRALNTPEVVRDATIERVKKAAEEIGYVANAMARSLVSNRSGVIGVIVPTLEDSVYSDTVQGISDELVASGLDLLVGLSNYDPIREEELVRAFLGRQIDGLIIPGPITNPKTRDLLTRNHIPVVETWDLPSDPLDMVVGFSNRAMAKAATEFLIAKGRRHILFLSPLDRPRAEQRRAGVIETLAAHQLPHADAAVHIGTTMDDGRHIMPTLMARDPRPDALFFNGDSMALGALTWCLEHQVGIPDQLAIIGLHDTPIARHIRPSLTSIRVPRYELGKRSAVALMARFDDPDFTTCQSIEFEIIERGTT
ncbi:LacI family DNA-binding transcriptional regulator [Salinicola lusitanus]|uniref:LacI family DNA-binding transcriptional regulator n=1 Tax=Salinicola lusitanus TaxID=1949085 RepID=UPI00138FEADA|nr:LacI family DNA-binding transcriptional regulator [Salinicola lusitanus]